MPVLPPICCIDEGAQHNMQLEHGCARGDPFKCNSTVYDKCTCQRDEGAQIAAFFFFFAC